LGSRKVAQVQGSMCLQIVECIVLFSGFKFQLSGFVYVFGVQRKSTTRHKAVTAVVMVSLGIMVISLMK